MEDFRDEEALKDEILKLAAPLREYIPVILVTLGAQGVLLIEEDQEPTIFPPLPIFSPIKSVSGAGDW